MSWSNTHIVDLREEYDKKWAKSESKRKILFTIIYIIAILIIIFFFTLAAVFLVCGMIDPSNTNSICHSLCGLEVLGPCR